MFGKILIAVDSSVLMPYLVRYAAALFPGAEYYLMSTSEPLSLYGHMPEKAVQRFGEMAVGSMNDASLILEGKGIKAKKIVVSGHPVYEILNHAKELDIDLLAFTSFAERDEMKPDRMCRALLERMECAALVVNSHVEPKPPKRILNPTTDSAYSRRASAAAVKLAARFSAELTTLYIGKDRPRGEAAIKYVGSMAEKKGVKFSGVVGGHIPFMEIMERSNGHDMIIGSRGRVGVGYRFRFLGRRLALGKLEQEVIASARIPQIIIGD